MIEILESATEDFYRVGPTERSSFLRDLGSLASQIISQRDSIAVFTISSTRKIALIPYISEPGDVIYYLGKRVFVHNFHIGAILHYLGPNFSDPLPIKMTKFLPDLPADALTDLPRSHEIVEYFRRHGL